MRSNMTMLVLAMFLGSLALPAECRPQHYPAGPVDVDGRTRTSAAAAAVSNNSSRSRSAAALVLDGDDERKLSLTLCIEPDKTCYCCPAVAKQYCHLTRGECLANGAKCTPKCTN